MARFKYTVGNGLTLLDEAQWEHFERICSILEKHHMYFDLSLMGCGKTYIALAICITFNLPLMVICPLSAISMWKRVSDLYKVKIIDILSYGKLRGQKSTKQLSHPYLTKINNNNNDSISYQATDLFRTICGKGLLLIIDEAQNIKNPGLQSKSVTALCDAIRETDNSCSRFAILSASLFDKQAMAIQMLRTIGFYGINSEKLYYYDIGARQRNYSGYKEIVQNCKTIDEELTKEIALDYLPEYSTDNSTLKHIQSNVYKLFTNVVLDKCSSTMPDPELPSEMKNGFYLIHNNSMLKLANQAKSKIERATNYDDSSGTVSFESKSLDTITKNLVLYEISLLEICVRETMKWFDDFPTGKVIIFTNYTKPLKMLHSELKGYGARIFNGQMSPKEREVVEKKFMTDDSCKVFIGNMQAGGLSLNLQDISPDGSKPRLVLLLPTYKMMDLYQATGRAVRRGMTSKTTVRIVYNKEFPLAAVFDSIARKSGVLMDINNRSSGSKRKYPGEFECFYEDHSMIEENYSPSIIEWIVKQQDSSFQEKFSLEETLTKEEEETLKESNQEEDEEDEY